MLSKREKSNYRKYIKNELNRVEYKFTPSDKTESLENLYKYLFGRDPFSAFLQSRTINKKVNKSKSKIYVIGNLEKEICKIGVSINPNQRLKEIQTGCPYKLDILCVFDGNMKTESNLHLKYKKYRLEGEWFILKDELLEAIKPYFNLK